MIVCSFCYLVIPSKQQKFYKEQSRLLKLYVNQVYHAAVINQVVLNICILH